MNHLIVFMIAEIFFCKKTLLAVRPDVIYTFTRLFLIKCRFGHVFYIPSVIDERKARSINIFTKQNVLPEILY
jgi:hypothetical protein